jgi:hypothetical protein
MMRRPWKTFVRVLVVTGLLAASAWPGRSEAADVSRMFSASEFARLATAGEELPAEGRYTVRVWAPAQQRWSLSADGQTLILSSRVEGNDRTPGWQTLGEATLSKSEPVKVRVDKPANQATTTAGKDGASGKAKAESARPVSVPAVLTLSTDPKYDPAPALAVVRGRLDSVEPPADPRRTRVRSNWDGAEFHAPANAQAWRDRARAVREQLLVATGLWPMFPKTPLKPQVYGKLDRDGYTIEKVVLETLPGFTLSGNLYRPAGTTKTQGAKLPALLCPHGHWEDGRVNPEVQQRCIRWAKLGCVVFMYDMVGYNDSKPFGHRFLNDRLRRWGLSLVTLQTWNSIRALDWLTSLPDVDPVRIGCTGESGGGTQTFLITALDDRIRVSAPVVMVSDTFQGGCVCENAAGLRYGTDNVEFAALTAPRPLKLVGASGDWTARTMTRAYPAIHGVYSLLGVPDRVSAEVFEFPHNYNQTTRNAVYAFMARWLLGIEDSAQTKEGPQTPEKPEELWTFSDKHPAPKERKTPAQLENDLVALMTRQLEALAPGDSPAQWEAARALLLTSLKVRVGLVNPTPQELIETEVRRATRDGLTIVHSLVGRRSAGEKIPVVRLIPAHPSGRLTVISNPHGKASLASADGKPIPLVDALLKRGQSVVGFDPLFVGESCDPAVPAGRRPGTAHYETYNPALAGDQIQDLATVVAWVRSQPDIREVSLIGLGRTSAQVLLARPALEGLARTSINLHEYDEGDGSGPVADAVDLPGMLQFGGIKAAAALTAPAPLWLYRTGPKFAKAWPERAYGMGGSSHTLRLDEGHVKNDDVARWIDSGE